MRCLASPRAWSGAILVAVGSLAWAPVASAQEDAPADTAAVPDSAAALADTLIGELPGELVGALADSAPDSAFAVLADLVRPAPDRLPGGVIFWDRERIRSSNALHLGELLAEMLPGSQLLRAGFVGGPAHLLDGPFGPTALDVRVDGRPLIPLVGAQVDLSQILLAMVDEVRARRVAGGIRVDLTTLRRTGRRAYSRIEAGSGDPDLESLRLVFTNGIGDSFAATAGFEILDADSPASDIQGFSGGLAWLPGGGGSGIELQYEQRAFEQTLVEARTGTRSRVVLGGRHELGDHVQAAAWIGESTRELDTPAGGLEEEPNRRVEAAQAGVELRGIWERTWASVGARLADHPSLPESEIELEGGVSATAWLTADASARLGAWNEFDTREAHVGAAARVPPIAGIDLRLYAQVGSGRRGASYPAMNPAVDGAQPADSVGFEALVGGFDAAFGAVRLGGRVARQTLDRQLGFGSGFDAPGESGPKAEVVAWEGSADLPVLPLSWLVDEFDPIRLRGFVRHNQVLSAAVPLYVPANLLRGEVYFEDDLLEGDLGVRLALGVDRRDPWLAPSALGDGGAPAQVPARTSVNFDLGIRILDGLIFWRVDNLTSRLQQDLPGFEFPVRRQVFGIRWAFRD